jgi:hypothetical protein
MSKTVTTTVAVTLSGDGFAGAPFYTVATVNTGGAPPGSFGLAVGFNTIPVPAAALGVTIVPPPGSVNSKILKGVTGDTGFPLAQSGSTVLPFNAAGAVASIGITSAAIETIELIWS